MNEWPLYRYSMDLLIDEDSALGMQPRWYIGAHDGLHWIYYVGKQLTHTYYKED